MRGRRLQGEGSTLSYTLTCCDRTVRTAETYHGDRYEGVLKTKIASGAFTAEGLRAARNAKEAPDDSLRRGQLRLQGPTVGRCH
jgi:hypothetical protein